MSEVSFEVRQEGLAVIRNTVIEANFDECKAALTEMVAPYKSLIVSEDGISSAKTDRAKIRKVASRVDEMRKIVKKAYSEPLKAFEDKCRELTAICDEGSDNLDVQIKAFERREADAKIAALKAEYDSGTEEAREYCPWERVFNPRWENKTYSAEDASEEIREALAKTGQDLEAIRGMGGADTPYLLQVYRDTHDLATVIRRHGEMKAVREYEEKRAQQEEERRRLIAESMEREAQARKEASASVRAPVIEEMEETPEEDRIVSVTFTVSCTREQLAKLGAFMKANGIRYGRPTA